MCVRQPRFTAFTAPTCVWCQKPATSILDMSRQTHWGQAQARSTSRSNEYVAAPASTPQRQVLICEHVRQAKHRSGRVRARHTNRCPFIWPLPLYANSEVKFGLTFFCCVLRVFKLNFKRPSGNTGWSSFTRNQKQSRMNKAFIYKSVK